MGQLPFKPTKATEKEVRQFLTRIFDVFHSFAKPGDEVSVLDMKTAVTFLSGIFGYASVLGHTRFAGFVEALIHGLIVSEGKLVIPPKDGYAEYLETMLVTVAPRQMSPEEARRN